MAVAPSAARLVEHESDLAAAAAEIPSDTPLALLAQTTLAHEEWAGIVDSARELFPDLWMPNRSDLCYATTNRQAAVRALAPRCDAVIVVGSANSSNTVALATVASGTCARVLRVNSPEQVPDDLAGVVGVTAGASAPDWLVEEIVKRLDPEQGSETIHVTDEDEYFPPPPELRDLLRVAAEALSLSFGVSADGTAPTSRDRTVSAAEILRPGACAP
jgi:4-hydroxy-3-methylbut-2-enyl diphosphate reductase